MRHRAFTSWGASSFNNASQGDSSGGSGFGGSNRRLPAVLAVMGLVFVAFVGGGLYLLSHNKISMTEPTPSVAAIVVNQSEGVPVEAEEVIVPIRAVESGQSLDPTILARVSLPRNAIPLGAVRTFEELEGMYARGTIPANQPIVRTFLTRERPTNSVVANIPEGFRAVTINVSATTGVEGWARAGAYVDVHWISSALGKLSIVPIVQNAKILSAERQVNPNADPAAPLPTTVTLLVQELDAQKISLTSSAGTLVLHMRGAGDHDISQSLSNLTVTDLFGGPSSENGPSPLEGIAKIRKADGSYEEYAILEGNVVRNNKEKDQPS